MKTLVCSLTLLLLTAHSPSLAADPPAADDAPETTASAPPALPPGMQIYYMVLLRRCPDRADGPPERLAEIQAQHMANIGAMNEEGILRLAGPFGPVEGSDLAGIFLLETGSLEAAEKRAAEDPAVVAGQLCPQTLPWLGPVGITHGYEQAVAAAGGS